jgi:hypothetical protein
MPGFVNFNYLSVNVGREKDQGSTIRPFLVPNTYYLKLTTYNQKKDLPNKIREGPNQKPLTIKPYPMKIHGQYR